MEWMLMPFKRYADFGGRSRRTEYWMFALFNVLVVIGIVILAALFGGIVDANGEPSTALIVLGGLYWLAVLIPSIAVTVRRFHDQDKSGWFYLLAFIPYIGGIIVFVFMCIEGTNGPNRFGADPKGGDANIFS